MENREAWSQDRVNNLKRSLELEGKRVILYFGKVKRSKGIEDICKAYQLLENRHDVKLVIAGSPTRTDSFLKHLGVDYPDVILTGYVEDPAPYYQLADLFCIYTDGFDGGETFAISLAVAFAGILKGRAKQKKEKTKHETDELLEFIKKREEGTG